MKYFLAVASCLNFSRAAQTLFISQSSLSQQIKQLEENLGVALFERNGKTIALTEAGELLRLGASQMLYNADRLEEKVRAAGEQVQADYPLRIYFDRRIGSDAVLCTRLTDIVGRLRGAYPFMQLYFLEGDGSGDPFADKEIDLWLTVSPKPLVLNGISSRIIGEERFAVCVSKRNPAWHEGVTAAELLESQPLYLLQNQPESVCDIINIITELGVPPKIVFNSSPSAITLFVAAGEGISVIPESQLLRASISHLTALPIETESNRLLKLASFAAGSENPLLRALLTEFCPEERTNP